MANRVKEDEKNERIIRNLLKLPDNRRCINCNSLGPQYVCTNFWTFVCTNCSGIHREFTHRVKSVSMAKFSSQEVSALQGGGNARAKEIYFKEWDLQRHSLPDSSNVERLRDFIKHVYVDRRYSGERSFDKPPRVKMGDGEDTYQGGSRSPQYEDTYERRYSDRPSPGGRSDDRNYRNSYDERRSPGYDQESRQYGDFRKSPGRTEIVNDWRREDRFGNSGRISDGGSKLEGRSPDRQKDLNVSSPPVVRPVREILGDNVSPLRIIEPPKADGSRAVDTSVRTQRAASSSSLASSDGNPAELKRENLGSLIDFDAVPEPPTTATASQTQQTVMGQSVSQPTTSSNADNWACFDTPTTEVKVTQAPSNANSLESVLLGLSVPASVPVQAAGLPGSGSIPTAAPVGNMSALPSSSNSFGAPAGQTSILPFGSNAPVATPVSHLTMFPPVNAPVPAPVGHMPISPFGVGAPATATMNNLTAFPAGGAPAAAPVLTSVLPSNAVKSLVPTMLPQQHSLYPATGVQPTAQPFTPPVNGPSSNQPWNSFITPNTQVPSSIPAAQISQAVSRAVPAVTSGMVNQSSPPEVMPSGRRALPEDLFTATYPSSVPRPGWQTGHLHGFGFSMQYNNAMPIQTFPQPPKSTNPFDFNNEISSVQAPRFPSMSSLQGALPNMVAPSGLLRTSSLGTPSPAWMPPQSSHPSVMPPQAPSFASAMPPSAYTGQQIPNNLPAGQQSVVGFGGERAPLGASNPNQQHQQFSGIYSAPATPNSFSTGGNPFG